MELLVNDLSIHGQFQDSTSFFDAIDRIMEVKKEIWRFGYNLYCHRNIVSVQVTRDLTMQQVVRRLDLNKQRALMQWLNQQGPFWEDVRIHSSDDYLYFETETNIVTDTAVGEAAFRGFHGGDCQLVSLIPSDWDCSPLLVFWHRMDDDDLETTVVNHRSLDTILATLEAVPQIITSWEQLATVCQNRFPSITISSDAFEPLRGWPFVHSAATRIMFLLNILEQVKNCYDEHGVRTLEGHRLFSIYFSGKKALFTDSSSSEKNDFKSELTFHHPDNHEQKLFCSWHGKVNSPKFRIHFSWPVSADKPLYVVYVGPKRTKQ